MSKTILIFSDGTGQIGGIRPDQRLSNIYKMYRAMRPGPDSPISPTEQVAFYDAGLGAGETGGWTFRRVRNILAAAVGTGIDDNVTDCYEAIIARYEPGDRICLFGFSRGAYTARALANVLNLCGVPTKDANGGPVPRYGSQLRSIASEGVRKVYNHGAGAKREKYEKERETLARRFRSKYGSDGLGADGEGQGNVQPNFIGVFDTVAALGSRAAATAATAGVSILLAATYGLWLLAPWWIAATFALLPICALYWLLRSYLGQTKMFLDDEALSLPSWSPRKWLSGVRHMHMALWRGKDYDRYVDREVRYLRHALAIDEDRLRFPKVGWGRPVDYLWNAEQGRSDWLVQKWFAGNHSDIGGSYAEEESRLSDIALQWMVDELLSAMGNQVKVISERLVTSPDPLGLQHSQIIGTLDRQPRWLRFLTCNSLTWAGAVRKVEDGAELHDSVIERLEAPHVPQMGIVAPYRPEALRTHNRAARYY